MGMRSMTRSAAILIALALLITAVMPASCALAEKTGQGTYDDVRGGEDRLPCESETAVADPLQPIPGPPRGIS